MFSEQLNSAESRGLLSAIENMREVLHDQNVTLQEIPSTPRRVQRKTVCVSVCVGQKNILLKEICQRLSQLLCTVLRSRNRSVTSVSRNSLYFTQVKHLVDSSRGRHVSGSHNRGQRNIKTSFSEKSFLTDTSMRGIRITVEIGGKSAARVSCDRVVLLELRKTLKPHFPQNIDRSSF